MSGYTEHPADAPLLESWRAARREAVRLGGGLCIWEAPEEVAARGGAAVPGASPSTTSTQVLLPFISKNMLAWGATCGEGCCAVDLCGKELCFGCTAPMHKPGAAAQPTRFVCLDAGCPEATGMGLLCEACMASPAILHEHEAFVRVRGGEHATVRRTVGLADRLPLPEECVAIPACTVCGDAFSASKLPGVLPGCRRGHTGVAGSQLVCAGCVADNANLHGGMLQPRGAGAGAGAVHCAECAREKEASSYAAEAAAARRAAAAAFAAALKAEGPGAAWRAAARAVRGALSLDEAGEATLGAGPRGNPTAEWRDFAAECVRVWLRLHPQKHIQAAGMAALQG